MCLKEDAGAFFFLLNELTVQLTQSDYYKIPNLHTMFVWLQFGSDK